MSGGVEAGPEGGARRALHAASGDDANAPVVFFGSGAFGVPTLERLASRGRVTLVVSQPDRPAGRGRREQPTPVAAWAIEHGVPLLRSDDVSAEPDRARVRAEPASVFVIIAFGQKLRPALLEGRFAVNLHGSLLPRWRGAAPIQRAVMEGDRDVGVSAISIAERMDAGEVYGEARTTVGERETAGELHDRLAALGPDLIEEVLRRHAAGTLRGKPQDESLVTRARKLSRSDAWVDFSQPARLVAARINGLSPWPGCDATVDGAPIKILRARATDPSLEERAAKAPRGAETSDSHGSARSTKSSAAPPSMPGRLLEDGLVECGSGAIELLDVQPAGGRVMSFDEWRRGRRLAVGAKFESVAPDQTS